MKRRLLTSLSKNVKFLERSTTKFLFDSTGVLNPKNMLVQEKKLLGKQKFVQEDLGVGDVSILAEAEEIGVIGYLQFLQFIFRGSRDTELKYVDYAEKVYMTWDLTAIVPVLEDLQVLKEFNDDIELHIFTNGYSRNVERFLIHEGIGDIFESIIAVDTMNDSNTVPVSLVAKPQDSAYEKAMELIDYDPENDEIYFVDDSVENLSVAKDKFGWNVVQSKIGDVVWYENSVGGSMFPEIRSLCELKEIYPEFFSK